jgi:hypothetical protein
LTADLYRNVEFGRLATVKELLIRFFSKAAWSDDDEVELGRLLPDPNGGWWEHDLGNGLRLAHGFRHGRYRLWVSGGGVRRGSIFDRVFSGPVLPEATPNPRHVRFVIGGTPGPSTWYRAHDEADHPAVVQLLADPDITDVLVAGDFVTVGLRRPSLWEERLDDILQSVTELFWVPGRKQVELDTPTRDELVAGRTGSELHLLDPDDPPSRQLLLEARNSPNHQTRRMAIATLAQSTDEDFAVQCLLEGFRDRSRPVRRTVIDVGVDLESPQLRRLFEGALDDADPWIRWKAIKGLEAIGLGPSREAVARLGEDDDFQVRFQVAAALRQTV